MNKLKVGAKVRVLEEYQQNEFERTCTAIILDTQWNKYGNYIDYILKFENGLVLPFGQHEIKEIGE